MSEEETEQGQIPEVTREGCAPRMAKACFKFGITALVFAVIAAFLTMLSEGRLGSTSGPAVFWGALFCLLGIVVSSLGGILSGASILFVKGWPVKLKTLTGVVLSCVAILSIPSSLDGLFPPKQTMPLRLAALGNVRTISAAQASFQSSCVLDANGDGVGDYGTLAQLGNPPGEDSRPFIANALAKGHEGGYVFTVTTTPGSGTMFPAYTCTAVPEKATEGSKSYFVDETGVIRFANDGTPATKDSPRV